MIYSTGTSEEKATFLPVLRGYSWPEVLNDLHGLRQIRIHLAVIKTKSQLPVIGLLGGSAKDWAGVMSNCIVGLFWSTIFDPFSSATP